MGALIVQGIGLSIVLLRERRSTSPALTLLVALILALMILGTQSLLL